MRTFVRNIRTIVNVLKPGEKAKFDEMDKIEITTSGSGSRLAILTQDGDIVDFGEEECILRKKKELDNVIDCRGGCVIPGFVDAHTHPVWAGDRLHEFTLRLKGASNMEIHEAGGGIQFTVSKTSEASEDLLYDILKDRIKPRIQFQSMSLKSQNNCWASRGTNANQFTECIINEQIPNLRELMIRGDIQVDNIDVICERGVFDLNQSQRILEAGRNIGLNLNFHADESSPLGGAELAGRLKARAASHLEEASPAGVAAMAASGTAAVLLPTTAHLLRLRPPPARAILQAGVPVALGTDFNPNVFCLSMPVVMYLACTMLTMTPDEALVASTINAAYSLNMSDRVGAITVGRQADLVVLDCDG
ncbi:Imidazolonepropionase [Fasciola gigantica]|uniref:Probable imidazolonepropionase n=1 Tax=Fasciola gigantica TaxID=46835 RepID=A0A504Y8L8_FASGI|nr:Imidazolonepropionase [Fasciola gigantica]